MSIEVDPRLAHDTGGDRRRGQARCGGWSTGPTPSSRSRPPPRACRRSPQAIAEGISVNVTLIFSLERYREVMDAYLAGLEKAKASGHDLSTIASVASFFVCRVDTEIDERLDKIGTAEARGAARQGGASPTPGSPTRRTRRSSPTTRWQALAAGGRERAAAAVGVDRRQGPGVPRHAVRRRAGRAGHGQHHARGDARGRRRPRRDPRRHRARAPTTERRQVIAASAALGITYDDVVQVLEDEGVDEVRGVLERAARHDQNQHGALSDATRAWPRRTRASSRDCMRRPNRATRCATRGTGGSPASRGRAAWSSSASRATCPARS